MTALSLSGQNAQPARGFTCPASVGVTEMAAAPAPWRVEGTTKTEHKFLRPSIYNGTPGKQEFELAPDQEPSQGRQVKQTWKLSDYRDMNLFVRCRYAGTSVTLVADLPRELKTCLFSFRNTGGQQPIASPVFECR